MNGYEVTRYPHSRTRCEYGVCMCDEGYDHVFGVEWILSLLRLVSTAHTKIPIGACLLYIGGCLVIHESISDVNFFFFFFAPHLFLNKTGLPTSTRSSPQTRSSDLHESCSVGMRRIENVVLRIDGIESHLN